MDLSQALSAIKQLAGQGDLEKALEQLLLLVDQRPEMAELAQALRVNKADFFQIKSQELRGTIAPDNARLAFNQITDNLLNVIQRIEAGKTTLTDERPAPPPPAQAWRYYTAGGIVALAAALLAWQFFFKKSDECPEYGKTKTQRVMILPLKQTGTSGNKHPELDIADELNTLFAKDPQLSAIAEADVNEAYDINVNYPNPSEAADIGANCGVEMVVWGKIRDAKDTVEVRYKLLNPGWPKAQRTTDPYLDKLLSLSNEGVWVQDAKTIAQLIYLVLANQSGNTQMAFQTIKSLQMPVFSGTMTMADQPAVVDTSSMLLLADYYRSTGKADSAISVYNHLLAYYPDNQTALRLRGSLNYKNENYAEAARDFQSIQSDPAKTDRDILPIRADAYLRAGLPEKARQDLEQIKKDSLAPKEWIKLKERSIADSLKAYQAQADQYSRTLAKRPADDDSRLKLAVAQSALGETEAAVKNAETVKKRRPKNPEAVKTLVEVSTQGGDIKKAESTLLEARRSGVSTKGISYMPTTIKALSLARDTVKGQK